MDLKRKPKHLDLCEKNERFHVVGKLTVLRAEKNCTSDIDGWTSECVSLSPPEMFN